MVAGTQSQHSQFGLISCFGTFVGKRQYPKAQKIPNYPIPDNIQERVLLFYQLIGQLSQIDLGINKKMEAAHHSLHWNRVFFSQMNLILLSSHLFLLPPSFVGSVVAFDTNNLGVCLSIKKGVYLAHEPNLDAQRVEFCLKVM